MCGEKLVTEFITRYMMGSPLRVRGKVGPVIQLRAGAGITPAWAGKRRSESCRTTVRRDHPRMGGEKFVRSGASMRLPGSPPHGRGKEKAAQKAARAAGITPA